MKHLMLIFVVSGCGGYDVPNCNPRKDCGDIRCEYVADGCGGTLDCSFPPAGKVCCLNHHSCRVGYTYDCPEVSLCFENKPTIDTCGGEPVYCGD